MTQLHTSMGALITVDADRFLLQKEDFAGALAALQKLAKKQPYDMDSADEVLSAKELPEGLIAAGLFVRTNDEGDIVRVGADDKAPSGAGYRWPSPIIHAIAKYVRYADIYGLVEDGAEPRWWIIEGGKLKVYDFVHRDRLVAPNPPPPLARGATATFDVRLAALWGDPLPLPSLAVRASAGLAVTHAITDGVLRVTATVSKEAAGRQLVRVEGEVSTHYVSITVPIHVVPEVEAREGAVIVAHRDDFGPRKTFLRGADFGLALREMKRYAARHADAPGGAFLKGVVAAEDVPQALRACGLEPTLDAKGNLKSFAPKGDRLAGDERFVVGLFASFAHRAAKNETTFALAFAHAPARWVEWTFLYKTLERTEAPRDV